MNEVLQLGAYLIVFLFAFYMVIDKISSTRKLEVFDDKTYIVCMKNLDYIITNYIAIIIKPKIEKLSSKYDLDPESKTNAQKLYNEELDKVYGAACKDIIHNYVSSSHKKIIDMFLNETSLILIILTALKEKS